MHYRQASCETFVFYQHCFRKELTAWALLLIYIRKFFVNMTFSLIVAGFLRSTEFLNNFAKNCKNLHKVSFFSWKAFYLQELQSKKTSRNLKTSRIISIICVSISRVSGVIKKWFKPTLWISILVRYVAVAQTIWNCFSWIDWIV